MSDPYPSTGQYTRTVYELVDPNGSLAAEAANDSPTVVQSVCEESGPNGALVRKHILAQVQGNKGPVFAPNFVGTFDVTMKGVKILDPAQAAALNVPAGGLATGYQVTYTPPKGAIKPGCTLILVQAYQFPGLFFGMSPTLDRGNVPRAANATLPSVRCCLWQRR